MAILLGAWLEKEAKTSGHYREEMWRSRKGKFLKRKEKREECRGVQPFGISGTHWKKKSCPGPHTKYTNADETDEQEKVLSKLHFWVGLHS